MPSRKKFNFEPPQVIAALRKTGGLQFLAANELHCSQSTLKRYVARYAAIAEVVQELKGQRVDFTEGKLWEAIQKGEPWAICFYLKTQAKDRGYTERREYTGRDGEPLLTVRYVNDWRKETRAASSRAEPTQPGDPPALPAPGSTNGAAAGESV